MTWKAYVQTLPSTGSDVEYWPVINGQTYKLYAQKAQSVHVFSQYP
jgi:hypothetical protein